MHALTLREKARIITASGYTSAAQTSGVPGGVVDQEEPEEDFFLPDICQAQSILLLVLIAELLVFVVVLANSRLIGFNWVQFGLASLFVQWIELFTKHVKTVLRQFWRCSELGLGDDGSCRQGLLLFSMFVSLNSRPCTNHHQQLGNAGVWIVRLHVVVLEVQSCLYVSV